MQKITKELLLTTRISLVIITAAAVTAFMALTTSIQPVMAPPGPPAATDVKCTGCVGTSDIAGGAVTTAKIATGAVLLDTHIVEKRINIPSGNAFGLIIDCLEGELATGGGYSLNGPVTNVIVEENLPVDDHRWSVHAVNNNAAETTLVGRVVCESIAP